MKKITTREKIVSSAFQLFYEKGFNATSIDNILKSASLNKGSLYYVFKGKKEVLLAVIEEKIAKNLEDKYMGIKEAQNPLQFLQDKLLTTDNFDFKHGCALNNLVQEMSPIDNDIANALQKIYIALEHTYSLSLRDLTMCEKEKKVLSKMMVATVEGAIMAAKSAQKKEPYIEIIEELFRIMKVRQLS